MGRDKVGGLRVRGVLGERVRSRIFAAFSLVGG